MTQLFTRREQEAKKKMMPTVSSARLVPFNLLNLNHYYLNRLYAIRTPVAGALR